MMRLALALLLLPQDGGPPEGAVVLFDGKDASPFVHDGGKPSSWEIVDGALEAGKGDLLTKETYQDFRLHVEFRIPEPPDKAKGNSGLYLQRRYEVQILDSFGEAPAANGCGSLYKQRAPDKNAGKKAGEWQSYDITFRAPRWDADGKKTENARITVVWNGVKVHDNVELTAKTGNGRPEGPAPGPVVLQSHGSKVRFRNIWIVPQK